MEYKIKIIHEINDIIVTMSGILDIKKRIIQLDDKNINLSDIKNDKNYDYSYAVLNGQNEEKDLSIEFVVSIEKNDIHVSKEEVDNIKQNILVFREMKNIGKKNKKTSKKA